MQMPTMNISGFAGIWAALQTSNVRGGVVCLTAD